MLRSNVARHVKITGAKNDHAALPLTLLLVICATTVFIGAAPTLIFGHDNFFLLENGWRVLCGQRPHVDFYSPWGPVAFLVVAAGLKIAGGSASGIGYGNALFALLVGFWAYQLGRSRLAGWARILFPLYLAALICAPYPLGFWPMLSTHAMVYNRYGYALIGLLIVECAGDTEGLWGGVSSGAVMALALFLKASFLVVAVPFLAYSLIFRKVSGSRLTGLAAGFGAVAFCVMAYLRFNLGAMIADLRMAGAARSALLTWKSPFWVIEGQLQPLMLVVALVAACFFLDGFRSLRSRLRLLVLGIFVYVADVGLVMTNAQGSALPLLPILALLIASNVLQSRRGMPESAAQTYLPYHAALLLFCLLLFLPQFTSDVTGLTTAALRKIHPSASQSPVRFSEPRLAPLILYNDERALQKSANGSVYTAYVNDGVALLKKYCNANDRVLTMDMQNPFPYAMGWLPPLGGIASTSFNYTFDAVHRPTFDTYFGNATVVMKPKHPAQAPDFIDGYYALFTPAMLDRFQLEGESDWFSLYRRK